MPVIFGTFKAAAYAMLFAIPLALAGAIYTAYFMTPGLRRVIKPAIEVMGALPTVVIGLVAGIWLAPIIEQYLLAVLALPLLLAAAVLLCGALTHRVYAALPAGRRSAVAVAAAGIDGVAGAQPGAAAGGGAVR